MIWLVATVLLNPARAATPPVIDGRLDEPAWSTAPIATTFVQKFPDEGQPPSEATTIRVLYDGEAIYVGVECAQSTPRVGRLTRRDREVDSDRIEIDLGTRGDGKSAFSFGINAAGVLVDGLRYDDTELDLAWDENWEAEVASDGRGWSVEVKIPLRVLRFPPRDGQSWDFQVRRYLSARQEIDEWAFIPRDTAGEVSHYGQLGPFDHLRNGHPLELRPFVLGRLRRRDATPGTLAEGTDATAAAGLDARWHVADDLTLDATVLPDFGQVEADQLVLNLTTYETFFPEKRPFFVEGLDAFALPVQVLYTRRIGRAPDGPALAPGENLVDAPEPSAILGAAKLVGQLGDRWSVGALAAVTGANRVVVQDAGGARAERTVEPPRAFAVLRLKRDLGDNAHLGVVATGALRLDRADADHHDAYVAGVDGRWRSPSGDYVLSGMALASLIENGPPRMRPDGTLVASGDLAPGISLRAAKEGGSWLGEVDYEGYAPRLDIDDLGYLTRANLHSFSGVVQYRDQKPGDVGLESSYRLEIFQRWNFDGLRLGELYQLNTSGKLANFWEYFVELHYRAAHFDDREVGDGTALERAGLVGLELSLSTDPRRRLVGSLSTQSQRLFDGWNFSVDGSLIVRALPQLDLEILPSASYTTGEPRFTGLQTADSHPLFGELEAASFGVTLRGTYTFTPRLTLQAYAQAFLAALHYTRFTTSAARTVRVDSLVPAAAPGENPDGQEAVVNANLVLRWEWRLGSTLYLVYSRSQSPAVGLMPGERPTLDLGAALRGPAADVFLLKWSFWWS